MKILWESYGKNNLKREISLTFNYGYTSPNGDDQHVSKLDYTTATFTDLILGTIKDRTDTAGFYNKYMYYCGGQNNYLDAYDTETNTKSSKSYYNVSEQGSFVSEDKLYWHIIGGKNSSGTRINYNKRYSFVSDVWDTKTAYSLSATAIGEYTVDGIGVLVAGTQNNDDVNTHKHYSFDGDSYTTKANYFNTLYGVDLFSLKSGEYNSMGGNDRTGGHRIKTCKLYTIATDIWENETDLPDNRGFGAASDNGGSDGYQYGGSNYSGAAMSTIYKLNNHTWSTFTNMTTARRDFGAVSI